MTDEAGVVMFSVSMVVQEQKQNMAMTAHFRIGSSGVKVKSTFLDLQ